MLAIRNEYIKNMYINLTIKHKDLKNDLNMVTKGKVIKT